MSPMTTQTADIMNRFPRVSGDEPTSTGEVAILTKFSPRERG